MSDDYQPKHRANVPVDACGGQCGNSRGCDVRINGYLGDFTPRHRAETDPRPCQGGNSNICVAEGCYGESCRAVYA